MATTRKTTSNKNLSNSHPDKMKLLNNVVKWDIQLKKISTTKSGNHIDLKKSIGMDIDYYINNNHIARVSNVNGNILWYIDERTLPSKVINEIYKDSQNTIHEHEKSYLSAIKDMENQIKKETLWCKKQGMSYEQALRHLDSSDYFRTLLYNLNVVKDSLKQLQEIRKNIISSREKAIHANSSKRRR